VGAGRGESGISRVEEDLLRGEAPPLLRPGETGDPDSWLSAFTRLVGRVVPLLRERLEDRADEALIAFLKLICRQTASLMREHYLTVGMGEDARYRTVLEAVYDGVVVVDAGNRQVVDINDRMLRLLSASREDVVGKEVLLFYPEEL